MESSPRSPVVMRIALKIKVALTADPTLAVDERRLAMLIDQELTIGPHLARIPYSLRDDDTRTQPSGA
jgi:hypothetical protein